MLMDANPTQTFDAVEYCRYRDPSVCSPCRWCLSFEVGLEPGDPNKEIDPERFIDKFVPGGGVKLEEDEPDADKLDKEGEPDE